MEHVGAVNFSNLKLSFKYDSGSKKTLFFNFNKRSRYMLYNDNDMFLLAKNSVSRQFCTS